MPELILALDFGGTKHTAGVFDTATDTWLAHERVFSPPEADARYDMSTMLALANSMLHGRKPASIGVSFGGPVNASQGFVLLSHHVPGWENMPLAQLLHQELGVEACVDNDANAAALGEHRFGAGKGCSSLLYITVSTGVGGGWVLHGEIWRGADSMAGEIGHTVIDPEGPECLCGKRGCLERLASGPYMAQDARARISIDTSMGQILLELCGGKPETITGEKISQAAMRGDALALELIQRSAWSLGVGIGNAVNLINPERVILGGGVTKSGGLFWERLRQTARETALPQVRCEVVPAALGDDAPLWGAVALGLARLPRFR